MGEITELKKKVDGLELQLDALKPKNKRHSSLYWRDGKEYEDVNITTIRLGELRMIAH
jgi:hypothetical protein